MKPLKDIFRQFTQSLFIYFDDAPKMDYQTDVAELGVDDLKEDTEGMEEGESLIKGKKFESRRKMAKEMIKKINLDANPKVQTQAEKDLEKTLTDHTDGQFDLLEHNYETALSKLGAGGEKIKQAEQILEGEVHEFIKKMDVHILQENVKEGNADVRADVIDRYIASKGADFQGLRGLGQYIIKSNGGLFGERGDFVTAIQNLDSEEKVFQELDKVLNGKNPQDNRSVLERAVAEMTKPENLPEFKATTKELAYFNERFDETRNDGENRLSYYFGENNSEDATKILGKRFHINFKNDSEEPEYMVDLTTNNVYRPGKDWDKKLKEVCHNELRSTDKMDEHNQGLTNLEKARNERTDELESGVWYRADSEVDNLRDLANNGDLLAILKSTNDYLDQANEQLDPTIEGIQALAGRVTSPETGRALDKVTSRLTPNRIRESGLLGQLKELMEMIQTAVNGSHTETLEDMVPDLEDGKNPLEKQKEARDQYVEILQKKKPSLEQLLTIHQNPTDAEESTSLFMLAASGNESGFDQRLAGAYPEQRTEAVRAHLESQLSVTELSIHYDAEKGYTLAYKLEGKAKVATIKNTEGGKLAFKEMGAKEPTEIELSLAALTDQIKKQPEPKIDEVEVVELDEKSKEEPLSTDQLKKLRAEIKKNKKLNQQYVQAARDFMKGDKTITNLRGSTWPEGKLDEFRQEFFSSLKEDQLQRIATRANVELKKKAA